MKIASKGAKLKLKPFMTYINDSEYAKLKRFAKNKKVTMAQIIREALLMRMAENQPYVLGFNAGVKKAMETVSAHEASKMRFPSGKSFAEILTDEMFKDMLQEFSNEVFER